MGGLALVGVAVRVPSAVAAGAWHLLPTAHVAGRFYGQAACPTPTWCAVIVNDRGHAGVMVTTSEGRTWRAAMVAGAPGGLEALACPSTSLCLAVGYGGTLQTRSSLVIERSTDGGASFTPVSLPAPLGAAGRGNQLEALACASASTCVAAGQATGAGQPQGCNPPTCTSSPPDAAFGLVVLATSDGGATWTAAPTAGGFYEPYAATCAPAGPCQVVGIGLTACTPTGSGGSRCGAAGSALAVTVGPAGAAPTWVAEHLPGGVFALNGVGCPDPMTCVAVGQSADSTLGHGVVLVSADGGSTWRAARPPGGTTGLISVTCLSARLCLATGDEGRGGGGAVFESVNAGGTWRVVARIAGLSGMERSTCAVSGFCLATGTVGFGSGEYGVLLAN